MKEMCCSRNWWCDDIELLVAHMGIMRNSKRETYINQGVDSIQLEKLPRAL